MNMLSTIQSCHSLHVPGGGIPFLDDIRWSRHLQGVPEVVLDGQPYVAPTLEQEIYAPKEWNLGKQPRTAMASLVGLKVREPSRDGQNSHKIPQILSLNMFKYK